jgi:hypothetical protein
MDGWRSCDLLRIFARSRYSASARMTMTSRPLVPTFDETPQLGLFGDRDGFGVIEIEGAAMLYSSEVARARAEHDDAARTKLDTQAGHGIPSRRPIRSPSTMLMRQCANAKHRIDRKRPSACGQLAGEEEFCFRVARERARIFRGDFPAGPQSDVGDGSGLGLNFRS